MATLNATGNLITDMTNNDAVDHAEQAAPVDSSQYSWRTTSGIEIHAFSLADDITFDATSPLSGTVHGLQVGDRYTVGGLVGDLVAMSADPETYWRAILSGETTIFASPRASFLGAGDFVRVGEGENLVGSADVFWGAPRDPDKIIAHDFYGDAYAVQGGATLTGAADEIHVRGPGSVAGDAGLALGTVKGGDDIILLDGVGGVQQVPIELAAVEAAVVGDVFSIWDGQQPIAPQVVGGDDRIVVERPVVATISGDFYLTDSDLGTSFGGDDRIDAHADTLSATLAGDIVLLQSHEVRAGDDTLIGSTRAANTMAGDAVTVSGGKLLAGADKLIGGDAADLIYGDFVEMTGGMVTINAAFTGDDLLRGGDGGDQLYGQLGDDILEGGMGNDFLDGGDHTGGSGDTAAFDRLDIAVFADLHSGFAFGQGVDMMGNIENIRGSNLNDTLGGDAGANRLEGLNGDDQIFGRSGNDTLLGGDGNDVIMGGDGRDTITGGNGADSLKGGGGADFFNYDTVAQSTQGLDGRDVIEGFAQGADLIDLGTIDAQAGVAGNQAFTFIGAAAFSAEGQIRAVTSGIHTLIQVNTTGTGGAEMVIELDSVAALTATDFVL